jgi:hypothetical protein
MSTKANNFRHNIPARQRIVVTVKGHAVDVGPLMFKIIGPNKTVQLRRASGMPSTILTAFRNGALEVKAYAYVTHGGRYHLIELVPNEGIEPSYPDPQSSALPLG